MRFTDNGDIEVFDGELWAPIRSVLSDPDGGIRDLRRAVDPGQDSPAG